MTRHFHPMKLATWLKARLMLVTCSALILLITITLISGIWRWMADEQIGHAVKTTSHHDDKKNHVDELVKSLPDKHLFGQSNVPVSDLAYHVTGIVKGSSDAHSKAYISIDNGTSKIYRVGDEVSDNVTVDAITASEVILKNNGRLEKLPLVREKLEFKLEKTP